PGRGDAAAVPGGAGGAAFDLPLAALEPVGGHALPGERAAAQAAADLRAGQRSRGPDASARVGFEPKKGNVAWEPHNPLVRGNTAVRVLMLSTRSLLSE